LLREGSPQGRGGGERFFAYFLARTRKQVARRGESRHSHNHYWIPAFAGMTDSQKVGAGETAIYRLLEQ